MREYDKHRNIEIGTNSNYLLKAQYECNQAICIACVIVTPPPQKKSIGSKLRGCDTFLLYFHSENANKHGTLEQVDYSWIEMI